MNDFEKAEQLHSQWSMLEKTAKFAYLKQEWQNINATIAKLTRYIRITGGKITPEQMSLFNNLLKMRDIYQSEGQKAEEDLINEVKQEVAKSFIKRFK